MLDNCPDDANTGQENNDADPLGDACDPCTGGASATKQKLTLTKLIAPAGDDKFSLGGEAVVPALVSGIIDPVTDGVRLLVLDSLGTPVFDATIPAGAYDIPTRTGWKANSSLTSFTYKNNAGTHPDGITLASVKRLAITPGKVKFKAKGKNGTYSAATANLPLTAILVLDPPAAATGECVEATWPAIPVARPSCVLASNGASVKCK